MNNKEGRKSGDGISVIMSNDALMNLIAELRGVQPSDKHPQHPAGKCKPCVPEDDDLPLCRGEDEPICATVTAATREDRTRTVQINACPSYFIVYAVCQDGTKVRLFKGKRGTIYGLLKLIAEESRKE